MAEYDPLAEDDDLLGIPQDEETPAAPVPDDPASAETPAETPESLTKADDETWQAAFTKARQKDRAKYGKIAEEHGNYKNVLQQFYTDDAYALSVLKQRFPQMAVPSGTPVQGTPDRASTPGNELEGMLQQELGNLSFLAPAIAKAMQTAVQQAIAPIEAQTKSQQETTRRREQQALQAEMDSKYPGWDDRYSEDMQSLAQFMASNELTHPTHGNKFELLYKLANPDQARIDATRTQQQAARSRQTVSRTGPPVQPNLRERVMKAPRDHDAFMLAARAAAEELGL